MNPFEQPIEESNEIYPKPEYFGVDAESNSRFKAINPEEGGSPRKYLNFIKADEERVESVDMERGSLIHSYVEDPSKFKIQESDKPEGKTGEIADLVAATIGSNMLLSGLTHLPEDDTDFKLYVVDAARKIGYNPKWGDDAIIKNVLPVIKPYVLEHLEFDTTGKIAMTKKTKEIVTNCTISLESHDVARQHLFREEASGINIFKETEIYWEVQGSRRKAKVDMFTLDYNNKVIIVDDLKSGAFNISTYESTFKYRRTYRQLAWYKEAIINFVRNNDLISRDDLPHWSWEFHIIAVETKDEFRTAVFKIGEPWIFKGQEEYKSLLARIAFHKEHGFDKMMEEYNNKGYMLINNPE